MSKGKESKGIATENMERAVENDLLRAAKYASANLAKQESAERVTLTVDASGYTVSVAEFE